MEQSEIGPARRVSKARPNIYPSHDSVLFPSFDFRVKCRQPRIDSRINRRRSPEWYPSTCVRDCPGSRMLRKKYSRSRARRVDPLWIFLVQCVCLNLLLYEDSVIAIKLQIPRETSSSIVHYITRFYIYSTRGIDINWNDRRDLKGIINFIYVNFYK